MSIRWTEPQQRAITLFGSDVCVPAGAGSGKTAVLVERYLHAVERLGLRPDEILAITFTDKAAAQMKRRVIEKAGERGLPGLRAALESAPIGTIHAFCARLLRENPVECGIDPEFRILSDTERELLQWRVFEALMESEAANPRAVDVLALYGEDAVRTAFARLIEQARASGRAGTAPGEPDAAAEEKAARAALESALLGVADARPAKAWTPTEIRSRESASAMRDALRSEPGWPRLERVRSAMNLHAGSKALKEPVARVREALEAWESAEASRLGAGVRREFLRLLDRYETMLADEKRRLGAYDFDDLIEKTLIALRAGDPVRRAWAERVRGRFRAVFVDEYQDVNPAQAALVGLLKRPGTGFVVGDRRQSIYGFRFADPGLFEDARRGASVVPLSENFRSRRELLAFVNAFFESRFGEDGPLTAAARYASGGAPAVELLAVRADSVEEGEKPLDRARVREAQILAGRLRALVDSKFTVEPPDGPPRPVEWRDIAVLFRKSTAIRIYDRAFREAGIPFDLPKGKGFFEKSEVVDLVSFLSILNDPHEDIPLAAVLRSPLAGLSEDALLTVARSRPDRAPFSAGLDAVSSDNLPEADRPRLQAFLERFRRFRASRERLGLSNLLEAMIEETGYRLVLAATGGLQALANVDKLIDLARDCEGAGGGTGDFVRLVRLLADREEDEPEAKMPADRGDAVSFLTVHAAKGLEFPVVVAADLGAQSKTDAPFYRASVQGQLGLRHRSPAGGEWIADPLYARLEAEAAQRALRESERLLYVAMTRARERLILTGVWKAPGKSAGGEEKETSWMSMVLATCGFAEPASGESRWRDVALRWIDDGTVSDPPKPQEPQQALLRALAAEGAAVSGAGRELVERLTRPDKPYEMVEDVTVTRLVEAASKEELEALLAEEPDKEAAGLQEEEDEPAVPANRFGTVYHKLMELSMRASVPGPLAGVDFEAWTREFGESEKGDLRRQMEGFWNGEWGKTLRRAGRRHTELPFIYKSRHGLLKGQIDLVFRDAGGWTILDYKTNRIAPERQADTASRYAFQLALYALVFSELTGERVSRGVLYFSALGRGTVFDYAEGFQDAVRQKLETIHLELARTG